MDQKDLQKMVQPRFFAVVITLFVVFGFLVFYLNKYLYKSKATQPSLAITFDPAQGNQPLNQEVTVHMQLRPADAGNRISAFDLYFIAGGNLQIVRIDSPTSVGVAGVQFSQLIATNNRLSYTISGADTSLPLLIDIPVVVKATTAGAGNINVDVSPGKSMVVGNIANYSYDLGTPPGAGYTFGVSTSPSVTTTVSPSATSTVTPSATPTSTPIPSSTGSMTLNLKLKFQGITVKPPDAYNNLTVHVTAVSANGTNYPGVADFKADNGGTWTGSVNLNAPAGTGYKILVKGPKHLQKRICDMNPTETTGGTYHCSQGAITLTAGVNNLDFSHISNLVGDLPEQGASGGQNGVTDSYDISYLVNNFRSTDPRALSIGDLNLDGIIDGQDYAGLLYSLSIKYDEL